MTPEVVRSTDSCLLCRAQLSTAQIVEQVVEALRLASRESKAAALGLPGAAPLPPITNIVFMGMGEPLHNLSAVMSAVDILCDNIGLQFSHNKVGTAVEESTEQSVSACKTEATCFRQTDHLSQHEMNVVMNQLLPYFDICMAFILCKR